MIFNPLSPEEKQIVLGTCLGDGHLTKSKGCNAELWVWHGEKQKKYLEWKQQYLPTLIGERKLYFCKNTGSFYLSTKRHPFLSDVYHLLYGNQKTITRKYLNLLGPLGIAVWWMDDGNKWISKKTGQRQGYLSTDCFSFEENELIAKWFRTIWGIEPKVRWFSTGSKSYPCLRFNAENLKRLVKLIKDYVPECMKYKVDLQYQDPETYNVEYLPTKTILQTVSNDIV